MATALKDARIQLNDPRLFREQCYVDGPWIDAGNRKTIDVTDPATGEAIGTVPEPGRGGDAARHRGGRAQRCPAWRGQDRQGALGDPAQMVRPDHGERRTTSPDPDDRASRASRWPRRKGEIAYGASFIEWFAEEAQARLRRHDPADAWARAASWC